MLPEAASDPSLHALLARLGIGAWVYELTEQRLLWNEAACRLHDLPPGHQPSVAEAIGYFAPEAQLAIYAALNDAGERGTPFDLELPLITAADRRIWLRCVAQPEWQSGRVVRLVGSLQDVSEAREARLQAQRSAELLRGALEALELGFALWSPDDRLIECNERYRQAEPHGAEMLQPGLRWQDWQRERQEPEAGASAWAGADKALGERRRSAPLDQLRPLPDGRVLRVLERALPDGHVVSLHVDLTELAQARERAEAAALAKGRFVAHVSHELRTPLNAVLGLLQLLLRTPLDATQHDYAAKADEAGRKLLALVNDTLDFSKLEAGRLQLDAQPLRLATLLHDVEWLVAPLREGRTVGWRVQLDPALPEWVSADALRLQQVLLNLASNALKFTEQGEVRLSVTQLARPDTGPQPLVRLRFEVSDTGIGMSPEQQARVFSGFVQAEASTTRRYGGTGLGLAISQALVQLMGARLQLSSRLGQGSRFAFELLLPLAQAPAVAPAPRLQAARSLQGLRLLLADDQALNRQVARELLEAEGARVHTVSDGAAAVQALRSAPADFDAVLMDVQMPVLDGLAATRALRAAGLRLPVVAITAHDSPEDRAASAAAGMDAHVCKPFDIAELLAVLLRVCAAPSPPAEPQAGWNLAAAQRRLGGDAGLLARGLQRLQAALPARAAGLAALPAPALAAELHALKGELATLGADAAAQALARAEALLRQSRHPEALQLAQQSLQALHFPPPPQAPPGLATITAAATPPGALQRQLEELLVLLEASDAAALDALEPLRDATPPAQRLRLAQLGDLVETFEFAQAAQQVRHWLQQEGA